MILSNCHSRADLIDFIYLPVFLILFHSIFIFLPYGIDNYHVKYFLGFKKSASILLRNPNSVAVFFCLFLPFLFYNKLHCPHLLIRTLSKILIPINVIVVLLTFSRAGFLMLVIILLWNLYYSKNKFSALIIASSIFISISIFLGSIAIDAYYKRIYIIRRIKCFI